jgi:hypothetical protein
MRIPFRTLVTALFVGCLSSGCIDTIAAPVDASFLEASSHDAADVLTLDSPRPLDAPEASTSDVVEADRGVDVSVDRGVHDVAVTDVAGRCDPVTGYHAFWCGCGRCNPSEIICAAEVRGCPLGCPSACPELAAAVCACNGGTCDAPALRVDAGTDAGVDAGGLAAGQTCAGDSACAAGLLCCYPCGIPGCTNRCGSPDPRTGRCPLLP